MANLAVEAAERVLAWLKEKGGYVHPHAAVQVDPEGGVGLFATAPIGADERLISCPFSAAITPALCATAICQVTGVDAAAIEGWNERQLVGAYIGLHWVAEAGRSEGGEAGDSAKSEWPSALAHRAYVASLPPDTTLTTPLYFSDAERALLAGTNLAGATADREAQWKAESEGVREVLKVDGLSWPRYRAVATYLSSRAFPSTLLTLRNGEAATGTPDAVGAESHPVLLPGLDMLNRAYIHRSAGLMADKRGQAITWLSSRVASTDSAGDVEAVSFVAPEALTPGEIFNNYGARSNESLLLAYGFVIPDNPDDTVVLRLGGAPEAATKRLAAQGLNATQRFEVRRDGELPQELLKVLRVMLGDPHEHDEEEDDEDDHAAHEHEVAGLELELDVLGALGGMLEDKLAKLESTAAEDDDDDDIRPAIHEMVHTYRRGQMEILATALDVLSERVERVEGLLADGPECPCGC